MNLERPYHRRVPGPRLWALLAVAGSLILGPPSAVAQLATAGEIPPTAEPATSGVVVEPTPADEIIESTSVVVLPFRAHSSRAFGYLTASLSDLLAARLLSMPDVTVVDARKVREQLDSLGITEADLEGELSDPELQRLAASLEADGVITGSVTELAGSFSLHVRLTPTNPEMESNTLVFVADSEEELIQRLAEVGDRVASSIAQRSPGRLVQVDFEGAVDLEPDLRPQLTLVVGDVFDPAELELDRQRMAEHPAVASVIVETKRSGEGVAVVFRVVPAQAILVAEPSAAAGPPVVEIVVRGNRRIETGAILARVQTQIGEPIRPSELSADVREIFGTGYFRNVRVYTEDTPDGRILTFEVEESPVIRQISISGNDNVDDEQMLEILTLTTGATLDYPLLRENVERIRSVYRSEGYYLADVSFEIEEITDGSIGVLFEVTENEKLKLRKIEFTGNEAFSDKRLQEDFAIKRWRFWSKATSWFDKSGTYNEPIFMRDLQSIERIYTDEGYLQVEVGEPEVTANEDGLFIVVDIREGPQFSVGQLDVSGDETMDIEALRKKLKLEEGEIFNRSHLTADVEALERHYTDRGFYFASVQPGTRLGQEEKIVDVEFRVEKGPLYFIRNINISGNTRTIDPVIRREMNVVEGQLYSARALQVSDRRVRSLGFFEDVSFEPKTTEDPAQLDLEVNVVERPTGSFSFGAGFSSQDGLVFTASLAQANLFGRGYAVNLSADLGGQTNRFFFSASDPSIFGTDYSAAMTVFFTDIKFNDFKQLQQGVDFSVGHILNEEGTARGLLRYSFSEKKIEQETRVNASAPIFREILQGAESTSLIGVSFRRDTRDDRFAATSGTNSGLTLEYAGLGGFSKFFRVEARHSWYLGAPGWLIDRSTFVLAGRVGVTIPFNTVDDFNFDIGNVPGCRVPGMCVNVANLDQISRDIRLPLSERYFLGGIGTFQLRGFKARSLGPRRAILRRSGITGEGNLFHPVGTQLVQDPVTGKVTAACNDVIGSGNQGDGNGLCNNLDDKRIEDFDDILETDVIGGNKFFTATLEYRFPISEEVGLQGVIFVDMGGAFSEEVSLFEVDQWRYGYGGGVLWFSPFGPLQLVLGFPVNPLAFEKSPVFEFSVGGFGL